MLSTYKMPSKVEQAAIQKRNGLSPLCRFPRHEDEVIRQILSFTLQIVIHFSPWTQVVYPVCTCRPFMLVQAL